MFRINQTIIFLMFLFVSIDLDASIKFSERLEEYSLENGLKVILIEDKRSPAVVNSIWYRVGSSNEVNGKTGISHILEHMMFKGTNKLGPGEFSSIVKKMGGTDNAFTSKDFTGYYQKVHNEDLERCIELESDRMINLKLDDNQIEKEIENINKNLSKVENVKKFFIINEKFSIENGMLTPTLKLKRFKIIQKYKNSIEKLYQ